MEFAKYTITRFVKDLRTIVNDTGDETTILSQVQPLACRAVGERSWLREEMYMADPELGFGTTLLHSEPDNSLFVVVDSWLPGRGVRPHDHGTWAVVVGVTGTERNVFWKRTDDGSRPGYAELSKIREEEISEGDVVAMSTGEIHSVVNETDETTLSFNVYGRHLNYIGRSQFDTDKNLEIPFIIETK